MKAPETLQQQTRDSDMIFTQISGAFENADEAKQAILLLYVPDMSISRAGISHALGRIERHYAGRIDA